MKIISGQWRGRHFYMPAGIRPTQNKTRKAIFDILGNDMEGLRMLDLFAGSGAVGLEALSLGAAWVVFVEREAKCCEVIQENCRLLGVNRSVPGQRRWDIRQGDVFAAVKQLSRQEDQFDVVYVDAPYGKGLVKKALHTISACDILRPNSFLLVEHSPQEAFSEGLTHLTLEKRRKYGKTFLSVLRREG